MTDVFTINPFFLLMAVRFGILLVLVVAFMWVYTIIRLHFSKFEKFSLVQSVKNYLIESSLIAILLFVIYFSVFITTNEWQRYVWNEWRSTFARNIYYMLLPEIAIFISLNILFIIGLKKIKKS